MHYYPEEGLVTNEKSSVQDPYIWAHGLLPGGPKIQMVDREVMKFTERKLTILKFRVTPHMEFSVKVFQGLS